MVPRGYGESGYIKATLSSADNIRRNDHGRDRLSRQWIQVCHDEMEYLRHKNVPFIAKNVHTDPEARKELIALGSKTIPTTVIGNEVIIGFEVERIKELVGI